LNNSSSKDTDPLLIKLINGVPANSVESVIGEVMIRCERLVQEKQYDKAESLLRAAYARAHSSQQKSTERLSTLIEENVLYFELAKGLTQMQDGHFEAADKLFAGVLTSHFGRSNHRIKALALDGLARCAIVRGQAKQALQLAIQANTAQQKAKGVLTGEKANVHYSIGFCYLVLGNYSQAKNYLHQAIDEYVSIDALSNANNSRLYLASSAATNKDYEYGNALAKQIINSEKQSGRRTILSLQACSMLCAQAIMQHQPQQIKQFDQQLIAIADELKIPRTDKRVADSVTRLGFKSARL
jgi:tetratricopeptide (TPR) repeat protein